MKQKISEEKQLSLKEGKAISERRSGSGIQQERQFIEKVGAIQ